jgi:hypothetical protein
MSIRITAFNRPGRIAGSKTLRMMKNRQRAVRANPAWCYLCGLSIPDDIVSPSHPLFGTIDHTIPRSRSGPDALHNRAPAHRLCNQEKGNRMIDPEAFASGLHRKIIPFLESRGRKVKGKEQAAAIRRVVEGWPSWAPTYRQQTKKFELQRWADDGGSVV